MQRVQRTSRAEINEEAWISSYSTVSRLFANPEADRTAVEVINHYGVEDLKVYQVWETEQERVGESASLNMSLSNAALSNDVVDQLRRYYLDEPRLTRFLGCFETAQEIALSEELSSLPFVAQTVAHLLREALGEISRAADDPSEGKWSRLSRDVVDAKTRVEVVPPDQRDDAIRDLYAAIDGLKAFHDAEDRKHERGLVSLVAQTTGATVVAGTARRYGRIVSELSTMAHGAQPLEHVVSLYGTTVELLELLFAPPKPRVERLDELALLGEPSDADAAEAVGLVTTDFELRRFLASVQTSQWLWRIGWEDVLRPAGSHWPMIMLTERLGDGEARSIAGWLKRAFSMWGNDETCAVAIASAARAVGKDGHATLLKVLAAFPRSRWIQREVWRAAEEAEAEGAFVEEAFTALRRTSDG